MIGAHTVGSVAARVVSLGVWCDYVDEHALDDTARFRVEEFATLSDDRRIQLSADRGWSVKGSGGMPLDELWRHLTVEDIKNDALNVVLPDDAEVTGDEHDWRRLAQRLRAFGVDTTPEELRGLPHDVVLSARLQARVAASGPGR